MTSPTRYPQELRERAVRMVPEHGGEYPSEWAALGSISAKLGMTRETLRRWVRRAQVNGGLRSGVTTAEPVPGGALPRAPGPGWGGGLGGVQGRQLRLR